jgi:SAM-dependent methyltransferase
MDRHLQKIKRAYDLTVEEHQKGLDPLRNVPEDIRITPFFQSFSSGIKSYNSGSPEIKEYLAPGQGMKFLDAGCSANLINYRLYKWPSTYYGVDISASLIEAMQRFAAAQQLTIGDLKAAEIARLPFPNDFFDIAAVIGILEYCRLPYGRKAIKELARVLKPGSRIVLDIPNRTHPFAKDMARLEKFLERPNFLHIRSRFENVLAESFHIEKVDDSGVMIMYFVRKSG